MPITFAYPLFIECSMVRAKLTPRIFISAWYSMFSVSVDVPNPPSARAFYFRVFRRTPVAFWQHCIASLMTGTTFGVVIKMVISSAYATTTVFRTRFPVRIPGSFWSKMRSSGSTYKAKSSMLMGHPCLTELWFGIDPDRWPLIWMEDAASSYMLLIRSTNQSHNP